MSPGKATYVCALVSTTKLGPKHAFVNNDNGKRTHAHPSIPPHDANKTPIHPVFPGGLQRLQRTTLSVSPSTDSSSDEEEDEEDEDELLSGRFLLRTTKVFTAAIS